MHVPCIYKSSTKHRRYELPKSKFWVHLKPEVLRKGLTMIWFLGHFPKEFSTFFLLVFTFEKNSTLRCFLFLKELFFWGKNRSLHSIEKLFASKKRKRSACTLILEMWHEFIILATFFFYLFNSGRVKASMILFKSLKTKNNSLKFRWKMLMISNHG